MDTEEKNTKEFIRMLNSSRYNQGLLEEIAMSLPDKTRKIGEGRLESGNRLVLELSVAPDELKGMRLSLEETTGINSQYIAQKYYTVYGTKKEFPDYKPAAAAA